MQVTIFGANGKVGSLVVAETLKRGYSVRAFIHNNSSLKPHPDLKIFQGDVYDAASVAKAIKGSDAVISALGSWGTPKKDILTAGVKHIIPAMQNAGLTRIISLTGAGSNAPGDTLTTLSKLEHGLMALAAGKILRDGEAHITLLNQSNLDWTVIRSPVMTSFGNPANYRLVNKRPVGWATINRASVALAMVDQLESDKFILQAPYICHAR